LYAKTLFPIKSFDYLLVIAAYGLSAWLSNQWLVAPIRQMLGGEGVPLALPARSGWIAGSRSR